MKCSNAKKVYCYCEHIENGICPIKEIKKLIDSCKNNSMFNTNDFVASMIAINLIEMFDRIQVNE